MILAASAFNNGGINERRLNGEPAVIEYTTAAGEAFGNNDQRSAMLPVTNGAAKLVPLIRVYTAPLEEVLLILAPGAINPLVPIVAPKLDAGSR
ncbi:MAG TPA: hypothetical protein VD694_08850 [Nitrososphaeraceae archaeon]|nr:hypothetical protein [Nitrososphaeraceae archaeon]